MMMLTCIKQHLSNIWSSIHAKFKQHWGLSWKKGLLIKNACMSSKMLEGINKILYQHMWKKNDLEIKKRKIHFAQWTTSSKVARKFSKFSDSPKIFLISWNLLALFFFSKDSRSQMEISSAIYLIKKVVVYGLGLLLNCSCIAISY